MTPELIWLTCSALLASSLWLPYIVGVNMHPVEGSDDFHRPPDHRAFPPWVHRAFRAQANMVETFVPFAALVVIAHVTDTGGAITLVATAAFFWLRLAHAAGMISGVARMPLRPLIFTASWLCSLAVGLDLLML